MRFGASAETLGPLQHSATAAGTTETHTMKTKKAKSTVETYYAVRIGNPGTHWPYFMVRRDSIPLDATPWLFVRRCDAQAACPNGPAISVVRVRLSD